MTLQITHISVIIPCLNCYPFIGDAIQSILNQTFQQFEIIIVDGGSDQKTLSLINSFIKKDNRIRIVEQKNGFIGEAANIGIKAAKYDLIARLDGDDIAYPDRLEKEITFLMKYPEFVLVSCGYEFLDYDGKKLGVRKKLKLKNPPNYDPFIDPNIPHQGVLMKKEAVIRVGGYRDFKQGEDYDLFLRLADYYKLGYLNEVLVGIRILDTGLTLSGYELQRKSWMYAKYDTIMRREGRTRQSFDEWELANKNIILKKRNKWLAGKELRMAGLQLMRKKYFYALFLLVKSFLRNPKIIFTKLFSYSINKKS